MNSQFFFGVGDGSLKHLNEDVLSLLQLIEFHGAREVAKSLKLVHHIELYHSDFPIDNIEKNSFYDVIPLSKSIGEC